MKEKYVSKKTIKPYRDYFRQLMDKIRPSIKKEGISFTYKLVGSAKRNLVIEHHNKGFDCDYQIFISKNRCDLDAKAIKKLFIEKIDEYKSKEYHYCEDSTSAITLKKVNVDEAKIEFSYDIVILKEAKGNIFIIRRKNDNYHFESLPDMKEHFINLKKIKGNEMWKKLRKIYYEKKMKHLNSKDDKKSFQILNEAVNEVLKISK